MDLEAQTSSETEQNESTAKLKGQQRWQIALETSNRHSQIIWFFGMIFREVKIETEKKQRRKREEPRKTSKMLHYLTTY